MQVDFKPSKAKNKRLAAVFTFLDGRKKTVNFGQDTGSTYIDHNDDQKKAMYIARHRVNENWDDPITAGALSRWILWNKKTLDDSIIDFKLRFNLF